MTGMSVTKGLPKAQEMCNSSDIKSLENTGRYASKKAYSNKELEDPMKNASAQLATSAENGIK
jgi:hypothetical protein